MRMAKFGVTLFAAAFLAGCGGSGDGAVETLSGTAATGAAIADAAVVFKDATGASVATTTDAQGQYSVNVTGMTPPFLGQVTIPTGGELFSIATETGTANIDPYSDLMTDAFFAVRGTTPEAVFPTLGAATDLPNEVETQALEAMVERMIQPWLVANDVDPQVFDIVTTPYMANGQGYDHILEITTITAGGLAGVTPVTVADINITEGATTQDSTLTADAEGNVAIDTVTTGPSGTSSSHDGTVIPPTAAASDAETAVAAVLVQFQDAVNAAGAALTSTDLQAFMAADLLHGGQDLTVFSAAAATFLRGLTVDSFTISRIFGFDEANEILDVEVSLVVSQGTETATEKLRFAFKKIAGDWVIYGDQQVAEVDENTVQFEMRTDASSTGTTTNTSINIDVTAATNTLSSVTVTGPGGFSSTPLTKDAQTRTDILEPTPTTTLNYVRDAFYVNSGPITLPTLPATYTITVNQNPTGTQVYSVDATGSAGEAIQFTVSPATFSVAAVKGQTITVSWSLPQTYAVSKIDLVGFMSDGATSVNVETQNLLAPTATSGMLTFTPPTGTPNPSTFNPTSFNLSFEGPNGERSLVIYMFDLP